MNSFIHGFLMFYRKWRISFLLIAFALIISLSFVFSQITLGIFEMYKTRNENPYFNYYRLVVDRKTFPLSKGYESTDKMYSGSWRNIKEINDYFLDIVDYTAEIYGHTTADIKPYLPPWIDDAGYFLLYGITDCIELPEFTRGEISLVEGRYIISADREKKNNVCIINETIATLNELKVNDVINFKMSDGTYDSFTIVGIYKYEVWQSNNPSLSYNLAENRVIVPLHVFEKASSLGCYNYQIKLNDESFIDEVEHLVNKYSMCEGFPAYFIRVSDISEASNREINALQNALFIVQRVFIVISAVLMSLFLYSLVKSRRREFGMFLSLGVSKANIILTLLVEFSISILIGILLSGIISFSFGTNYSEWMINEIENLTNIETLRVTTSDTIKYMDGMTNILVSLSGNPFVLKSFIKALLFILSSVFIGMVTALREVCSINVMNLLTKQE